MRTRRRELTGRPLGGNHRGPGPPPPTPAVAVTCALTVPVPNGASISAVSLASMPLGLRQARGECLLLKSESVLCAPSAQRPPRGFPWKFFILAFQAPAEQATFLTVQGGWAHRGTLAVPGGRGHPGWGRVKEGGSGMREKHHWTEAKGGTRSHREAFRVETGSVSLGPSFPGWTELRPGVQDGSRRVLPLQTP